MNQEEFVTYAREITDKVIATMSLANKEYAREGDKFDNFNRIAAQLRRNPDLANVTNVDVAKVYLLKHIDSLIGGVSLREPMEGRLIDIIAYVLLIGGMMQDADEQAAAEEFEIGYSERPPDHPPSGIDSTGIDPDLLKTFIENSFNIEYSLIPCFNKSAHEWHFWLQKGIMVKCPGHEYDYP